MRAARGKSLRAVPMSNDDLAVLQYTGGTTGKAKGAMLLHRNLVANIQQSDVWFGPRLSAAEEPPVMVTALPLYHIFALTACFWFQMRMGGSCLLIVNPSDIHGFVKTLQRSRFHIFAGVNTLYNALADHPDIRKVDFSWCCSASPAAWPCSRRWRANGATHRQADDRSLRPLRDLAGVVLQPARHRGIHGHGGLSLALDRNFHPRPGRRRVPHGETGEICARGPQIMAGYWDRPMATEAAMTADGFFRTGDGGMILPDGQIKIVDRLKDLIIVSGFNVYPNEVEDVLVEHPDVREAAVVGRPSDASGEEVVAFVVPRGEGLTEEALRAFCRERLTGYKTPRAFIFRDELPKTNVGKVLRRSLKELL